MGTVCKQHEACCSRQVWLHCNYPLLVRKSGIHSVRSCQWHSLASDFQLGQTEEREEGRQFRDFCSSAWGDGDQLRGGGLESWGHSELPEEKVGTLSTPSSYKSRALQDCWKIEGSVFHFPTWGRWQRLLLWRTGKLYCLQEAGGTPVSAISPSDPAGELEPQTRQVLGQTRPSTHSRVGYLMLLVVIITMVTKQWLVKLSFTTTRL